MVCNLATQWKHVEDTMAGPNRIPKEAKRGLGSGAQAQSKMWLEKGGSLV